MFEKWWRDTRRAQNSRSFFMAVVLQDWTVRYADDRNPMQASPTVYTPLDADVFIDEITSTIEGKLRERIGSLINDNKAQRELIESLINDNEGQRAECKEVMKKNAQLSATIRESDAEITKLTGTNSDLVNRVDELLKKHDDLATENVQLIETNKQIIEDNRKIMATPHSNARRIGGYNRTTVEAVSGERPLLPDFVTY